MGFPEIRLRRLRQSESIRKMVRETLVSADDLIMPLFVKHGKNLADPIDSMPGQFQFSVDRMLGEVRRAWDLGIQAVILFGIPKRKDAKGSEAYAKNGIVQVAAREIKQKIPGMQVIADCCFCEYTDHGHCGIMGNGKNRA